MRSKGHRVPVFLALVLAAAPVFSADHGHASTETLTVGQLTLRHCDTPAPWCGTFSRPLDPQGTVPGTVPVYFEYWPHTGGTPAAGMLVATEGGPGFPATESRSEYLELFEPLRGDYDVLIMDNRGTGRSGAVECHALQQAAALTEKGIGACGRALGQRVALYSTALAADDLAALLQALGVARIGLYGDSYGTYFSQVFTLRHPDRLRAVVLDGAYPLDGPDYPWYPHYAPAMREKFNRACERSSECSAIPGSSMDHIAPALKSLRAHPFEARVRTGELELTSFRADAAALATVMFGSAPAYASVRETDAAARAFVEGDRLPLLRLMAETRGQVDSRDPTHDARLFSAGLAAAVSCGDPPQIFDMTLPPRERVLARDHAIAQRQALLPDTYAPFSIAEYRRMPLDYAFIDECVDWPARTPAWPSSQLVPDAPYPDIPVLVVSGELDNMTSAADGAAAAARFPGAHHVVIANGFHVNALAHSRSECGALLVRRFFANLSTEDDRCAAEVPPVRLVPRFARRAEELSPAAAIEGNQADQAALKVVTAALLTCEDAIARAIASGAGTGLGLRDGTVTVTQAGDGFHLALHGVRWTADVAVSGEVDWPGRTGDVHASVTLEGPPGASGALQLEWPEGVAGARATARGTLGTQAVAAQAPAP
ncbi:MAG: alpha/beta hydrolase [Proteobacteria bacterium]|nr:alpha/beta hydrolase [Pseudomonadota bacterium]